MTEGTPRQGRRDKVVILETTQDFPDDVLDATARLVDGDLDGFEVTHRQSKEN